MNKINWLLGIIAICFIYIVGNYFFTSFSKISSNREGMMSPAIFRIYQLASPAPAAAAAPAASAEKLYLKKVPATSKGGIPFETTSDSNQAANFYLNPGTYNNQSGVTLITDETNKYFIRLFGKVLAAPLDETQFAFITSNTSDFLVPRLGNVQNGLGVRVDEPKNHSEIFKYNDDNGYNLKFYTDIVKTSSPAQASPVQASPVQASPVQASPVQASPVQASPDSDHKILVHYSNINMSV
jgi:hypothetical protein